MPVFFDAMTLAVAVVLLCTHLETLTATSNLPLSKAESAAEARIRLE